MHSDAAERDGWSTLLLGLMLIFVLWAISLERSYAYLGLQSRISAALMTKNLHPLSVDFALSHQLGWDWRRQLIGWWQQPAQFENTQEGLRIRAQAEALDLRFPFSGGVIDVRKVKALSLRFNALGTMPRHAALVVHQDVDTPGWIAELPVDLGADVDLSMLEFAREPERVERRRWQQLPNVGFVRLYMDLDVGQTVVLQSMGFVSAAPVETVKLHSAWSLSLLSEFETMRQAGTHWPLVGYQGKWLGSSSLNFLATGLIALACLSQFWLWHRRKAAGAAAAWSMGLSFAPVLLCLYFDAALGASTWLIGWVALPIVSFAILQMRQLVVSGAERSSESIRQAVLISLSLAGVAVIGFAGVGQGLTPLFFDLRMAASYLLFAALQQFLLQGVVVLCLEQTRLPRSWVVLLAAFLFALWHLPNLLLMLACFVAALLWCAHFLRFRAFAPLIVSHACLGWLLSVVFPEQWLRSAKIGVMYFW